MASLERHRILRQRKNFVNFLNSSFRVNILTDQAFNNFKEKFGINREFNWETNAGDKIRAILMTLENLPDRLILKKIMSDNDLKVVCRIRHYQSKGFSKTYYI